MRKRNCLWQSYVCLTRNIEQVDHSVVSNEDEMEVIQSKVILRLCGLGGNRFDTDTLIERINLTPGEQRK